MSNNFTPLATNLGSSSQLKESLVKKIAKGIKTLISFIFGCFLFLIGIFLIITSIYGMKDVFLYSLQSIREIQHFNTTNGWFNLFGNFDIYKRYFTGFLGIIAGNLFLFSSVNYILHKKSGLKFLLLGLSVFLLNFILAVIFYVILKFK